MNNSEGPQETVERIIEEYIRPNSHLLTMERIHEVFTGEKMSAKSWSEIRQLYMRKDWTDDKVREFGKVAKQIVEQESYSLSESYFDIHQEDVSIASIEEELSNNPYQSNASRKNRNGFEYVVENGKINGRYIYTDVDIDLSYSGEITRMISEGAIEFSIYPEENLLVLKSTSVVDVQKTKAIFAKETSFDISVCGQLTAVPDQATDRIIEFINSFDTNIRPDSPVPTLISVTEVGLYNPSTNEEVNIEGAIIDGGELRSHPQVNTLLENGCEIDKISIEVMFRQSSFEVTIAGTSMMGYARIDGIKDHQRGLHLMDYIREKYLTYIRPIGSAV
ncbi:hypothetical protein [Natrinema pallidum]|uniref:Uncharacterized protein n=1 Tax=Natrinema pallidum TaxID=69527 RepID=A0A4V1IF93_9EURY|nr:hypothetical protein [Natrinema pallidum]QCW04194.1 hypothetical protein FGF80_13535 [Natrinema pallidum]